MKLYVRREGSASVTQKPKEVYDKSETKTHDPNIIITPKEKTKADVKFYSPLAHPFRMYGLVYDDNRYLRMPKAVAESVSDGVRDLSQHTAGGRICFKTNSPYIVIMCKCYFYWETVTMPLSATHSFMLYIREGKEYNCHGLFVPNNAELDEFTRVVEMPKDEKEREVIIETPMYSGVSEFYIGLAESATLNEWSGFTYEKPAVFYGSSITQGCGVSFMCNTYVNMLARHFDMNIVNLGMAGHCKAEPQMIDYIASLPMSMLVYDYDHNAPTPEFLRETHYAGYLRFREKCPDTPVILASRPNFDGSWMAPESRERREIILETYEKALAQGDKNIVFADGGEIYATFCRNGFANDNVHPNDLGFYHMARVFAPYIKKFLK